MSIRQLVEDSIKVVGVDETVALLWDLYLNEWPADTDIEAELARLDPNWVPVPDDVDPPEGHDMLCPANG